MKKYLVALFYKVGEYEVIGNAWKNDMNGKIAEANAKMNIY
jgi:hypothetical protein